MQHLVIKNVSEEPWGNELLVQQRIDPDHAILFLDRAENKILFGPAFPFPAPDHCVTAQLASEIALVQAIEICPQIEMFSFMLEIELPLHWQFRMGDFSFRFFGHVSSLNFPIVPV